MTLSKYISILLAFVMLLAVIALPASAAAEALPDDNTVSDGNGNTGGNGTDDENGTETPPDTDPDVGTDTPPEYDADAVEQFNKLNNVQQYFLRLIGSYARADYYKTDVLASITLSQGIYEGGWGRYSLPVGGRNLFGIKAYSTWSGKVYDQRNSILYNSYPEYLLASGQSHVNTTSAWRAHASWIESVSVHSSLFINESKYASVVGEKDFSVAAHAIVDAGYCNDDGYADTVISLIKQYGMTFYDDLTPDSDGIVAIVSNEDRVMLDIGETHSITLTTSPADIAPSSVVWKSDNESVATVDENGKVTAVAHGMALISATLKNGREAVCIVYVDTNATVIEKDAYVYSSPSKSATNNGKIYRGAMLKTLSETVYTDSEGNKFYKVTGYNSKGVLVSGYAPAEYIYLNKRNIQNIAVVKDNITLKKGTTYTVLTVISPADAVDTTLTWTSSNESVATVDQNGVITAKSNGTAVVTASAVGGTERKINVTVAAETRTYVGVVSAYTTLTVRKEASDTSARAGILPYLTQVTVIGEPVGKFYKVSGKNASGTTVTGYVNSVYVQLVPDGFEVIFAKAPANVTVYADKNTSSRAYSTLAEGTDYAVISKDGDWSYIIGLIKPDDLTAVHGYTDFKTASTTPNPDPEADEYYARTTSALYIRTGAGSGYEAVGRFASGAQITVIGEAENGWYKVSGTDINGNAVSGYSSADYIVLLYSGVTTSKLNVRDSASTSGNVVTTAAKDTELTVIGDAENGWYKVELTVSGETVSGYCSADYITVNGKLPAEGSTENPPVVNPDPEFAIIDDKLTLVDGILKGTALKTAVDDFLKSFTGNIKVYDKSGNEITGTTYVGTGSTVYAEENGELVLKATVLVMGDVDGNGKVSSLDYLYVKRHCLKTYTLKDVYYQAGLLSGRDKIGIIDYIYLKRAVLGTYVIA